MKELRIKQLIEKLKKIDSKVQKFKINPFRQTFLAKSHLLLYNIFGNVNVIRLW